MPPCFWPCNHIFLSTCFHLFFPGSTFFFLFCNVLDLQTSPPLILVMPLPCCTWQTQPHCTRQYCPLPCQLAATMYAVRSHVNLESTNQISRGPRCSSALLCCCMRSCRVPFSKHNGTSQAKKNKTTSFRRLHPSDSCVKSAVVYQTRTVSCCHGASGSEPVQTFFCPCRSTDTDWNKAICLRVRETSCRWKTTSMRPGMLYIVHMVRVFSLNRRIQPSPVQLDGSF